MRLENGVGKLAAKACQMPAWDIECGELPPQICPCLAARSGWSFLFLEHSRKEKAGLRQNFVHPHLRLRWFESITYHYFHSHRWNQCVCEFLSFLENVVITQSHNDSKVFQADLTPFKSVTGQ